MSRVFVDTSALLALVVGSDQAHAQAREEFGRLRAERASLLTSSYVLVETYALLQSRIGIGAVRVFREAFAPLLEVLWVDEVVHEQALDDLLVRDARKLSLVDACSFALMRANRVDRAFAFDAHFRDEGYTL
jgi:predicted nucleic acid-binding protein